MSLGNSGSFTWNVDSSLLQAMISARTSDRFNSDIFEVANLKWRIECYPNGNVVEKTSNSFLVFVRLLNLPEQWQAIKLQRRVDIPQTNTSCTFIPTYDHEHLSKGWPPSYLLLSEVRSMNLPLIQIKFSMKIIQIVSKKENAVLFHYLSRIQKEETLQWIISPNMLTRFEAARNGQLFESEVDIVQQDPLMVMHCYPNGRNEKCKGFVSLYFVLINIPFLSASSMKIQWTFSCKEKSKLTRSGVNTLKVGKGAGAGKFCKLDALKSTSGGLFSLFMNNTQESITFVLHYKILAIYNEQNEEIAEAKWNENNNQQSRFNYNQCFLSELLSWTCIKCQKQNGQTELECKQCTLDREYNDKRYLEDVSFEKFEKLIADYPNITNHRELFMQSVVKTEANAFIVHSGCPSMQRLYALIEEQDLEEESPEDDEEDEQEENETKQEALQEEEEEKKDETKCTGINKPSSDNIENDKEWNCPLCTFLNGKENAKCMVCNIGTRPPDHVQTNENNMKTELEQKFPENDDETQEVRDWLSNTVKLPQYIDVFVATGFDHMMAVQTLNEEDLVTDLGIDKKGHRRRILAFIEEYKQQRAAQAVHRDPNDNNMNVYAADSNMNNNNNNNDHHNEDLVDLEGVHVNVMDTANVANAAIMGPNVYDTAK